MMNQSRIFVALTLALTLSACGKTQNQRVVAAANPVALIEKDSKTYAETKGDATGSAYTGKFTFKFVTGRTSCEGPKVSDLTSAPVRDLQATVDCTQKDGKLDCKVGDGEISGSVNKGGDFKLGGTAIHGKLDGFNPLTKTVAMKGEFSAPDTGTGVYRLVAQDNADAAKKPCWVTYMVEISKAPATPAADQPKASVAVLYETERANGQLSMRDVQYRQSEDALEIGARGIGEDRLVARIDRDGSTDVSAMITSGDGTAIVKGPLSDCTHEIRKGAAGSRIDISCDGLEASVPAR